MYMKYLIKANCLLKIKNAKEIYQKSKQMHSTDWNCP